jgi:hypothetical protein
VAVAVDLLVEVSWHYVPVGTSWVDVAELGCWLTSFGEDNKEDKERGDLQEIKKPKAEDLNQY